MYRLNADQQKIIDTVRAIADRDIAPQAAEIDQSGAFPRAGIKALGDAGLLGLTVPKEFGGMGEGLRTTAAALDEVAQRCASTAMVYLMHICGVSCYVAKPEVAARELRDAAA